MLTQDEILSRIQDVLVKDFEFRREQITPSAHLIDDLDFDSIDAIDLVVRLDDMLGLSIDEEELKSLRTIGDVVELVARHLERGEA